MSDTSEEVDLTPLLIGRQARCGLGKCSGGIKESLDYARLAFFEYRGDFSRHATKHCVCGFFDTVHQEINPATGRAGITDHKFEARGAHEFDSYYCGCRGWD